MKKKYTVQLGIIMFLMSMNFYVHGQTYNFTNATATGNVGPTQVMADAAYLGTTLDGNVTVTAGIQYWTVPISGNYQIEAYGGQGYGNFGGRGAQMIGEFSLTAGTVLKIIVGQMAPPPVGSLNQYAGGGGSFVTTATNTPYVIAGGGGGNHGTSFVTTSDASITNSGYAGVAANSGAGGTLGSGGISASSADAGGGLLGNGDGIGGGLAFVNGGNGGAGTTSGHGEGGFGCGGGTSSWDNYRAGGGGGYSGEGGAGENGQVNAPAAGGGGSFNSGTSQANLVGIQIGHGSVVISNLCLVTSALVLDTPTLSDLSAVCSIAAPTAPTATNNCGIVTGTPDVTFPITTVGTTVVTWTFVDGVNTVTQTQNITLNVIDNGISQLGDSLNADMSGYSYQWLYCDSANAIIPGETNQAYTPTVAGNYAVEVTSNGCVDTSACLSFSFVGVNEMEKQSFVMYPNPSNDGMFTITTKSPIVQINVFDALGRTIQLQANPNTGLINGSSLASGKYIVRVITEEKVYTKQLMILK